MKITFIRHSEVLFKWRVSYDTSSFESACRDYDLSPVKKGILLNIQPQPVYLSNLRRSEETAKNLLQKEAGFIKTDLLNEVPLQPFVKTTLKLPAMMWMIAGRLQWYYNHANQLETKKATITRINLFLDMVLTKNQDCIVVGHGFYFSQMVTEMKKRGIVGNMKRKLKNEELRVFDYHPLHANL